VLVLAEKNLNSRELAYGICISMPIVTFFTSVLSVVKSSRLALRAFGFQQVIQEEGVPFEVASGEAAGFGGEAVGPCEACALHPGWGVGFCAGIDIEGEADGEKDAAGKEGL
jgi:hypothetical protein